MIWRVDGGYLAKERLNKLGLYCHGGENEFYTIYSYKNKDFKMKLTQKQFDNIEIFYNSFYKKYIKKKRKEKLQKIKNNIKTNTI